MPLFSTLRVSRQSVSVLYTKSPPTTASVTRQFVEVLCAGPVSVARQQVCVLQSLTGWSVIGVSAIELTDTADMELVAVNPVRLAESTITLSDLATRVAAQWERDAESVVSLTSDLGLQRVANLAISDTVDLQQEGYLNLEGYSAIETTDASSNTIVRARQASDTIACEQDIECATVYTRQAISVSTLSDGVGFIGPKSVSAQTTITLTDSGYRCQTVLENSANTITLVGTAVAHGPIVRDAHDTLSLLSIADHKIFVRTASSEILVTDQALSDYYHVARSTITLVSTAFEGQLFAHAGNSIELTSVARTNPKTIGPGFGYDIQLPATVISLQQAVDISIKMVYATSTLEVADALNVKRPYVATATTPLRTITYQFDPDTLTLVEVVEGLADTASTTINRAAPKVVQQYLQWTQTASSVHIKSAAIAVEAEDTLALDQDIYTNVTGLAVVHLTLTDVATVDQSVPVQTLIELSDVTAFSIQRPVGSASTFVVGHSLAYVLYKYVAPPSTPSGDEDTRPARIPTGNPLLYEYHPFIGEGLSTEVTPPPATLIPPVAGVDVSFQLRVPATGTLYDSIELRSPNLGNKDRLSFNRIVRETRGGTLMVYADPMWPKIQTLVLSFSGLTGTQKDALLSFLDTYLGQEIGLLDWEHRYWKGVIVKPDMPVVQDDRNSYTASFEFEGELDPTWHL
jgi:hypothetical protein